MYLAHVAHILPVPRGRIDLHAPTSSSVENDKEEDSSLCIKYIEEV